MRGTDIDCIVNVSDFNDMVLEIIIIIPLYSHRCSPRAPKLIRNSMVPRDPRKQKNLSLASRSQCTGACAPRTDQLNYQTSKGFLKDHPIFQRVSSILDDDSSSDNSSSIFSEANSCSTESSTKDSTSTDDCFDQIFGESGHNWNSSWWNSSDSDTSSSSSSPSPLYSKNIPCTSSDHYATRYNQESHYSADCAESADDGHVRAKQSKHSNVESLKGQGGVPILYSDQSKHCRKLDSNSNCSSCRETNLDKLGKLNSLSSGKSGISLRKSSRGKLDKD